MNIKTIFYIVIILVIIYPAFSVFLVDQAMQNGNETEIKRAISAYQLSIWISWLIFAILAIYYKWTTEENIFFYTTYGFLILGFSIYGYYIQKMVNLLNVETGFRDNYTFGVFTAIQNLAVAGLLTGFLQAAVWWFTRRWHRR